MSREYKPGDLLSEVSYYKVLETTPNVLIVQPINKEGDGVRITKEYLNTYCKSADYYDSEVTVTKERSSKSEGMKSIFDSIGKGDVFTVCFTKQDTPKTKKALKEELDEFTNKMVEEIEKAKKQKKSISSVAFKYVNQLTETPILPYIEGEERVLRGFKLNFNTIDGLYDCWDVDSEGVRRVNIRTIKWLIYNNVKYIVK